jgi:hypothetical protein
MILKRQEKNGKIKAMYSSSTICASIFDTTTKDLTVIFNNGGQYKYPSIDLTDYTRFETAESNGTTFNTYIKKKYSNFEKLDKLEDAAVKAILTEVEQLKGAEDSAALEGRTKAMLETITGVLSTYISTGKISQDVIEKLKGKISDFEKVAYKQPETTEAA